MFLVSHPPDFISPTIKVVAVNLTAEGVAYMNAEVLITGIVCGTAIIIFGIFAVLAHSKEKAILKYKNSSKNSNKEFFININNDKNSDSKKLRWALAKHILIKY